MTQDEAIALAIQHTQTIRGLQEQIDALLEPVLSEVIARGNVDEMIAVRDRLPEGFHRSELRTLISTLSTFPAQPAEG